MQSFFDEIDSHNTLNLYSKEGIVNKLASPETSVDLR
jgi:hypothetical protein